MSLVSNEGGIPATMLVGPTGMNGYNQGGFGNNFGGDGWWILLLILLCGNNGFGGFGNGAVAAEGSMLYPWMNQADITASGIQNLSTQLCNGFAGVNATVNAGFANAETSANARQIANMQNVFGLQTAMSQGFNQIGSQFADCCCENRLASADLKYTIATENCADRAALSDGLRDVLAAQNAGTQRILDQLCQDKIDAKNDEIAQLRQQLNMATLRESQTAQNAFISQGFANEVDQLYNRLSNCPVPTTPVYGRTPIFTCNNQNGCGCGSF